MSVATNALLYDPRYHTFVSWASLMVELYAQLQLEIPDERTDWRAWGNGLFNLGFFSNESVPKTEEFENWYDWAQAVVGAVNPRT
jgi:hypothetical protein